MHRRAIASLGAALVILLAAATGGAGSRAAVAVHSVDVYPVAGTTTANPATQISFRGATHLASLTVTGSKSGRHDGRFESHSDGHGMSFLPDHRFRSGELVTVRSATPLTGAGRRGAVRFRILTPLSSADRVHVSGEPSFDPGGAPPGVQRFRSRPDLRPPGLAVTSRLALASSDDIFLAPKAGPGQEGPLIRDAQGRLIWFRPLHVPLSAYDFRVQDYLGRPVLTWWQGTIVNGKGRGHGVLLDIRYHLVRKVFAGNGYHMDQHEFVVTPAATAYIIAAKPLRYSLRSIGGPRKGIVWDSILQEIDVRTGLVMFEWHSLAHVPVSASVLKVPSGRHAYDPFHANSISVEGANRLLVSSRNTDAVFEIDRHTGRVIWRLGGRGPRLRMAPGRATIGQHDAIRQPDGTITLFDNGSLGAGLSPVDHESRGMRFLVNDRTRTATLVREYRHPGTPLFTPSQGSMQVLPGGNVFLSWGGGQPYLTELTSTGQTAFEARITPPADTYRAYRLSWRAARPTGRPAVAAVRSAAGTSVYASWNGATDVAHWEVLAGTGPNALAPAGLAPWRDFETQIQVLTPAVKYAAVRALDSVGGVLGTSATIRIQ